VADGSAHTEALRMLARRELSEAGVRARLADRGFPPHDVDAAIARLRESRALDDGRVARAYARTAVTIKGRGRLRVLRELHAMGITGDVAAQALGEVFGELDERALVARAIQKKLRGRTALQGAGEAARLYRHLVRQGFSPAAAVAGLRGIGAGRDADADQE
jgi:regulatory protein